VLEVMPYSSEGSPDIKQSPATKIEFCCGECQSYLQWASSVNVSVRDGSAAVAFLARGMRGLQIV